MRAPAVLVVAVTTLAAASAACGGHQRCLGARAPSVGQRGADEMYGLLHREHARSKTAAPLVRARIIETLPSLIPDASDRADEPTCAPELVDQADDALGRRPVVFSRDLVARIRAAGTAWDVVGVMDAKAAFLIAVATLRDDELTAYQPVAGEAGPRPARSFARHLALAHLGHSNVFLNVPAARRFVIDRLRAGDDDLELLLLAWHAREAFDGTRRLGAAGSLPDGERILRRWIGHVRARLAGAPDPVALEALLVRLEILGRHAAPRGLAPETRALLDEVIAARGRFALTSGVPGADRDLVRLAAAARHDLDHPPEGVARRPSPQRTVFDPRRDALEREPAGGRVSADQAAARLATLDAELARMTRSSSRCAVIARLASWVPVEEADRRFDALSAPVFRGDEILTSAESTCRIVAALSLPGVAIERRARFLSRMLRAANARPYDSQGDDGGGHIPGPAGIPVYVSAPAARQLAGHLAWIDASPQLRTDLAELALAPLGTGAGDDELRVELQPAFEHLLAFHAKAAPGADRQEAVAILEAWMATIRTIVPRDDLGYIYAHDAAIARLLAIAELAPRFGLTEPARALLAEVAAAPLPSPRQAYLHPALVRAAGISLAALGDQ